ncbi:MAG TPA: SMP-30/gluconolactonase/LRE family protein [Stackebrandtia sp.]|jgi:sugar lactone lactonase YvrE|uniref:SMP-30/gluconolactonase/LRE family protein n=1 Tax=Stackebrandtia sp. TaxID=2023065 RepID=UPI002D2B3C57|nr:SMP-30/gluconolactonase/LRE family protein [Stackebrandtia sp.]HZE39084.1 SMP-30/gluconolactonase/LRE family protein [Stackebrandtia sp.]
MTSATPITAYTCELGEGARWVDGRLVHTDILSGRLLSPRSDGTAEVLADLDVPLGAVAPIADRPGEWIAAAGGGIAVLSHGRVQWLATPEADRSPATRMNDGSCDPRGRLWAGSMAYDNTPGAGCLYRVDGDGTVVRVLEGLTIPNGPAWSPGGDVMYLSASADGRVDAYPVDAAGDLGAPEVFAQLETGLTPDGLTVDADGGVWVAVWDGAQVRRYLPDGTADTVLELPTSRPTSCCFGGPDLKRLYVTTASYGLNEANAGGVYAFDVGIAGRHTAPFVPLRTP